MPVFNNVSALFNALLCRRSSLSQAEKDSRVIIVTFIVLSAHICKWLGKARPYRLWHHLAYTM